MGMATLREFASRPDGFEVIAFARKSAANARKLAPFLEKDWFRVEWGDLCNPEDVKRGVKDADYVIHMGGMVTPMADFYPQKTLKVNVEGARNVARGVKASGRAEDIKVINIGSVAQMGDHRPPHHWGRSGDSLHAAKFDAYSLSKILAEREIVESGIGRWLCLRQTSILYPELLLKGATPITFHVPLGGVLEWVTVEDSARLMVNLCERELPDSFWNHFYNIGGGEGFRLTNLEFESKLMKALGCPPPVKVFEPNWFATRNFHGLWFADSDRLEALVPFRSGVTADEYFRYMASHVPWWMRLAPLAPSWLIKMAMRQIAKQPLGPLRYIHDNDEAHIEAMFGTRAEWEKIGDWKVAERELAASAPVSRKTDSAAIESHGYDEQKPESELDFSDMQKKAAFEGGECLSATMRRGDLSTPLEWRCRHGHRFSASPALILLGGHWCPECYRHEASL